MLVLTDTIDIHESRPEDLPAIEALYPAAFPEEDLLPVVRALLRDTPDILSLVATADAAKAGHIVFTPCGISGQSGKVALLGPLAVAPVMQRRGIGSALVRKGLERLEAGGIQRVLVLGDPAYYGRFGFTPDKDIAPPYSLPDDWREAWRSLGLGDVGPLKPGTLAVPPAWRVKAYWGA